MCSVNVFFFHSNTLSFLLKSLWINVCISVVNAACVLIDYISSVEEGAGKSVYGDCKLISSYACCWLFSEKGVAIVWACIFKRYISVRYIRAILFLADKNTVFKKLLAAVCLILRSRINAERNINAYEHQHRHHKGQNSFFHFIKSFRKGLQIN